MSHRKKRHGDPFRAPLEEPSTGLLVCQIYENHECWSFRSTGDQEYFGAMITAVCRGYAHTTAVDPQAWLLKVASFLREIAMSDDFGRN